MHTIKDILQRDPTTPLVNQGQARITDNVGGALDELKGELSTFVCEGEYGEGVQKILRSFLDSLSSTNQRAAWVSGFFGSGKSHLLKMLCHLWRNTEFLDGSTARSLVPDLPDELRALLRELDTAGKRTGGLVAAAGSLPSGTTEHVRLTILAVLLKAVGLPEQYPQARFCMWLKENGHYDQLKTAIEAEHRDFQRELNNLYVSNRIAHALLACDATFATDEAQAKQQIKAQFPPQATDITTDEFLRTAKDALKQVGRDGRMPCTLLVLDEAQQYIGDSNDRSVLVTEVAEAVSKQLDSHVIMVCAGQSALTNVPLLYKMMDRFRIRIPLSDADVETVTRKVLLRKKPSAVPEIKRVLAMHAGEVSRQLQGTKLGEVSNDARHIVDDFPLLPVCRRFWEECFRQIDAAGTQSQLRSQLRVIHDALEGLSDAPMTSVIPADGLYEALAPEMINTGVLLREIAERITRVGTDDGELARRICGLVFLIGKLKRDDGADTGVRASKDHIADLLVNDLATDNGKLRSDVATTLDRLAAQGALMQVGNEYRMQTREGAEWDRDFRNNETRLGADVANVQFRQDQLLYAEADRIVRAQRLTQGDAREPRQLRLYQGDTAPTVDGTEIPVWIRDGWSCSQKDVEGAARAAGTDSPVLFVFIARQASEDLKRAIIESEAARRTIDAKGNAATDEGREAKTGMQSRCQRAEEERSRLIREIVANAKVYQGGGAEVMQVGLDEKLKAASQDSQLRLFPRFKEADSSAWPTVIKRARDGADQPFQPVHHTAATETHAVCQQVLSTVGAGKSGTDIRKALRSSPFGWPQDAIDAALIALHRSQHLAATLNGTPVQPGQLDQNKIAKTEFRAEAVTLSATDKIRLRKLFQSAGIPCKSGEESVKAGEFLQRLRDLAQRAGGNPPLPPQPSITAIEDLQRLAGNEQLAKLKDRADVLEQDAEAWKEASELAEVRLPTWKLLEKLIAHASQLKQADPLREQVAAICDQRQLLAATDPVPPLRQQLAGALREALTARANACMQAYTDTQAKLDTDASWGKLSEADRATIRAEVGLTVPPAINVSSDERLLESLDACGLDGWRAECDAMPTRAAQALERAAKLLEPKVQPIAIERATLHDQAELEAWLGRQRKTLADGLKAGPVLVR